MPARLLRYPGSWTPPGASAAGPAFRGLFGRGTAEALQGLLLLIGQRLGPRLLQLGRALRMAGTCSGSP